MVVGTVAEGRAVAAMEVWLVSPTEELTGLEACIAHKVGEGLDDGSSNGDNVDSSVSSSMLDGIEPAVREQILATNKLDLALYKRTVELYHERCPVPRVLRRRATVRQPSARRSSKALGIGLA